MTIEKRTYNKYTYLTYGDGDVTFTNADYFTINTQSKSYKDIMDHTGGFVADMTSRHIKNNHLDCSSIMLCCLPQEYNDFLFAFVYLNDQNNILDCQYGNNPNDYLYFKKKFSDCISKKGKVYDFLYKKSFREITKDVCLQSSPEYSITVDGKHITEDDILFCPEKNAFSLYADEIKENIRKSKGIGTVLSLDFTVLNGFCFNCNVVKSNGELLSNLQVDRGIVNDQELKQFVNLVKEKNPDLTEEYIVDRLRTEEEPSSFSLSYSIVKSILSHLSFYQGALNNKKVDEDKTMDEEPER